MAKYSSSNMDSKKFGRTASIVSLHCHPIEMTGFHQRNICIFTAVQ